jgi:hypothetical protein
MAIQTIGVGAAANDNTGDTLRLAFQKVNSNFAQTPIISSLTTNKIPKVTGSATFGDSLIFDNGTNVGIGTTSPSSKLHVANTNSDFIVFDQFTKGVNNIGNGWKSIFADATDSAAIGVNNGNFIFYNATDSIERMRITSSGNVGINNTSPTSKLHVSGLSEYATNSLAISGGLTAGAFYHTAGVLKVVI